jgi:glutamate--cysteine ligase
MKSNALSQVPHLKTASNEPLHLLEKNILDHQVQIESWLRQQWRKTPPLLYSSVDLRNAGFKLAPVDTNLFSAGFNNLNPDFMTLAIQAAQAEFEQVMPGCTRILIIPENHTRNLLYFESLATLQDILLKAGYAARIGSLNPEITKPHEIVLPSGKTVLLEPVQRQEDRLGVQDFTACLVLLNNDLSDGVPAILKNIKQPIFPPLGLGWDTRLKSNHFRHYNEVAAEFAQLINIDPWLINPLYRQCDHVNFLKREGEDQLFTHADELLKAIQKKYDEYGIKQPPFLVIKADAGTYGMGVMSIYSADELHHLNRKRRTHMSTAKGNRPITKVLIQEGVYTLETWQQAVAEPVVYMLGRYVIGGFYRLHAGRSSSENLNSPGMQFAPLAFVTACNNPEQCAAPDACPNRFYAYGVIARLALVAAAREQQELKGK